MPSNKNIKDAKIAFFGSSTFSETVLSELYESGIVPAVVITAPDSHQGRGKKIKSPAIVELAREYGIDVLQPEELNEEFVGELSNTDWDLFVVVSYGKILPESLLEIPRKGVINLHPSMLPQLRGANPVRSAIFKDTPESVGVTVMLMDEKMDHGPILAQAAVHLDDWPPIAGELYNLLAHEGGQMLTEVIPLWLKGEITPEEQNHDEATYTQKVSKEDAKIDLKDDSYQNFLKIRAFSPTPGAYFFVQKGDKEIRVKITEAEYNEENNELVIKKVIPEGKQEMDYEDFLKGLNQ